MTDSPPSAEMLKAVDEMFKNLEGLAPDPSIIGSNRQLPGIVLDRIKGVALDRDAENYKQVTREYERLRTDYLKALVAHPLGRVLALLAVGPDGVAQMEFGRSPSSVNTTNAASLSNTQPLRGRKETYNCHHIIPRSFHPVDRRSVNHPENFVVANTTRKGRDQSQNPHHCWHSLILHPQTHHAPDKEIDIYVVRPLFPFYPPLTQGFRSAHELRSKLKALGVGPLPEVWEKRLLEFSKICGHKPYRVPKEFYELTQQFGDLYRTKFKDPIAMEQARNDLAQKAAKQAADWLPAGAYINGKPLPPNHHPKNKLPIIQTTSSTSTQTSRVSKIKAANHQKNSPKKTHKKDITPHPSPSKTRGIPSCRSKQNI
jgi:hypothetical protein